MEINIYSHLFPQAMAALAFFAALVPVTIIVIAANVATASQLAAAFADANIAERVARFTTIAPWNQIVVVEPDEFVRVVQSGDALDFRAGGIPVRTPRPTRERATA